MNRLLSVIFISRFGQVLIFLLVNSGDSTIFPYFYQLFTPIYYAAPACFYLYVTTFISGRIHLRKFEWLYFIPALLAMIHVLPLPVSSVIRWELIANEIDQNKQLFVTERSGLFSGWFYYLGRPFLLLTYLTATWVAVLRSKVRIEKMDAGAKKWIFFFLRVATFFQLISFIPLLTLDLEAPLFKASFILINCTVLLMIIIFILHQPKLFYGYLFVEVDLDKEKEITDDKLSLNDPELPKTIAVPKKTTLLPEQLISYVDSMKSFMESKRPYLQSDFQIVDLANELNIPVHHCSFVINSSFDKNFRDWINGYRIAFFIRQYPIKSDRMTIEAIAYESGFKSLTTFYNAFKKETGLMPKAFFSQQLVS
ncbi:helix-turn-helix domain-containing protein [Pedobacter gandavensis]|uniref:helix-turn-helix domain-containing protein n=1 Tax=Pedobacter gandavensis TaxID=2679963 RepID=UPI00247944E8|nr:helix-turn-helix domain-containing protein [Pedobacter gandavensis]WGQ11662.1 helix-turn-helix domain-containing protein [Pedobacter gandavensis]